MTEVARTILADKKTIGFVPTMGALHEGHLSLVAEARKVCDVVVASIFINPTQFNDPSDFEKYPRTLEPDLHMLEAAGCDIAFVPENIEEVFPPGYIPFEIDFAGLENTLEGAHRPGHFKGVANVVSRLFRIVQPTQAFFGLKDYQQYLIICKLVEQQGFPIKITGVETLRDPRGLALSSRNQLLSETEKVQASHLFKGLQLARKHFSQTPPEQLQQEITSFLEQPGHIRVEYFEIADGNTLQPLSLNVTSKNPMAFVAARVGKVRLIDNIFLKD